MHSKRNQLIGIISFTPGNVRVSSKHVLSHFYDSDRVPLPITSAVESTGRPAVSTSAETQQPLRMTSDCGRQELVKLSLIKGVPPYYCWIHPGLYNLTKIQQAVIFKFYQSAMSHGVESRERERQRQRRKEWKQFFSHLSTIPCKLLFFHFVSL